MLTRASLTAKRRHGEEERGERPQAAKIRGASGSDAGEAYACARHRSGSQQHGHAQRDDFSTALLLTI
jgi:hypothetical protein